MSMRAKAASNAAFDTAEDISPDACLPDGTGLLPPDLGGEDVLVSALFRPSPKKSSSRKRVDCDGDGRAAAPEEAAERDFHFAISAPLHPRRSVRKGSVAILSSRLLGNG